MELSPDGKVDLRGLRCPFTLLELGKALKTLKGGGLIEITSDHESIIDELQIWCTGTGVEFVASAVEDDIKVYLRKP